MIAEARLWHTADGECLVPDDHPQAAVLAYAPGDEIAPEDQNKLSPQTTAQQQPAPKGRAPAASKRRTPAADK